MLRPTILAAFALVLAGCGSDDSGGPGDTVAITVASGQGTGDGTVAGSGFTCNIVGGLASGTCVKNIGVNAQIAIAATATAGSVFAGWGGICAGKTTATCLLTVTAAGTATAKFDHTPP